MLELVSVSDANVIVSHGGSTLLTCVAMSPYAIQYHWFKDSEPLSEHSTSVCFNQNVHLMQLFFLSDPFFTQPAPGMLQIQMASLSLAGEYKCVVSSNQDSFERVFHLQVCPGKCLYMHMHIHNISTCSDSFNYRYQGFW